MVQPYSSTITDTAWNKILFYFTREIRFLYDQQPVDSSPYLSYAYVDITFNRWDIATKVCEQVS